MSLQLTRITQSTRAILGDSSQTSSSSFLIPTAVSTTALTLPEVNTNTITLVTQNGVTLATNKYSLTGNILTITNTIPANAVIIVTFTYYAQRSDSEIKDAIRGALSYLAVAGAGNILLDDPVTGEFTPYLKLRQELVISMIAAIILKPLQASYRTSIMFVTFPEKMSKDQKIYDVIAKSNFCKVGYMDSI